MVTDLMNRSMRRNERGMEREECFDFLKRMDVGRLGLTDGETVYVVPVNFTLVGDRIYVHGAAEGLKMDLIGRNDRACFEADEFYGIKQGVKACEYSARYRSVIVFGRIRVIDSNERKVIALRELMKKHTSSDHWPEIDAETVERVKVLEMSIEKISGKKANV